MPNFELYEPEEFQTAIDGTFEEILGKLNRTPAGEAHIYGQIPQNPSSIGTFYVQGGDERNVFLGNVDAELIDSWFQPLEGTFPIRKGTIVEDGRLRIVDKERTLDEKAAMLRKRELGPCLGHEIQHCFFEALNPEQRARVIEYAQESDPNYDYHRDIIADLPREDDDVSLDHMTTTELLAETRRLVMSPSDFCALGYFGDGLEALRYLAPLIPLMDGVTKAYVDKRGIKTVGAWYRTGRRLIQGQLPITERASYKERMLFVDEEPLDLTPSFKITFKNRELVA